MTTRHFGKITNQRSAKIDRVDLCVRFAYDFANIATAVTAMVVFTIGDQQKRFLRMLPALQLG